MKLLEERIKNEGKVLPGSIIKVDGFLNHRIDIKLLKELANEFRNHFTRDDITMIMTAEASGIALATVCAEIFDVPMVFAKKAKSDNIEGGLYKSDILSYTYRKKTTLILSEQWLSSSDKVLIIDDFMAMGNAVHGLVDICNQAKAEIVGIGIAIEKGFQGGGDALRERGYDVLSLAIIEEADENHITFRQQ